MYKPNLTLGANRIARNITIPAVMWICLACSHTESVESVIQTSQAGNAHITHFPPESHFPQTTADNSAKLHREAFIIAAQRQGVLIGESQVAKMQDLLCEMDPDRFDAQKGFFAVTLNQMQELNRSTQFPRSRIKTLDSHSPELEPIFQAVRSDLCASGA